MAVESAQGAQAGSTLVASREGRSFRDSRIEGDDGWLLVVLDYAHGVCLGKFYSFAFAFRLGICAWKNEEVFEYSTELIEVGIRSQPRLGTIKSIVETGIGGLELYIGCHDS